MDHECDVFASEVDQLSYELVSEARSVRVPIFCPVLADDRHHDDRPLN